MSKSGEPYEADKTYRVVAGGGVDDDVAEYFEFIAVRNREPENAMRWALGLDKVYAGLARLPTGRAVLVGTEAFDRPLRQAIYHSHRVIYEVFEAERVVRVLYVWHGARRDLPDYRRRNQPLSS